MISISREQLFSSSILLSFLLFTVTTPPPEPCRAKGQRRAREQKKSSFFFSLSLRQHNSLTLRPQSSVLFLRHSLQERSHRMHWTEQCIRGWMWQQRNRIKAFPFFTSCVDLVTIFTEMRVNQSIIWGLSLNSHAFPANLHIHVTNYFVLTVPTPSYNSTLVI